MKKKVYLWSVLAMGLTLAACSDDLENGPDGGGLSGEKGYVKVAINLPTEGFGTRAAQDETNGNDVFEKGENEEYAVKDVIIALFQGAADGAEADASFVTARSIVADRNPNEGGDNANNIQVKYTYTMDGVPLVSDGNQMYALVILNNNDLFTVSGGDLLYNSTAISSFADLQKLSVEGQKNAKAFTSDGFLMLNAPISDIPSVRKGTSFDPKVTTLAKVMVHETEPTDATTADQIYVERAVAKVEVSVNNGTHLEEDGSISLGVTGHDGHSIKFTRWALNVTNKSSKIVRDITGYDTWEGHYNTNVDLENRFFGMAANPPYRVYWAVDNNYDNNSSDNADTNLNRFTAESKEEDGINWLAMYNPSNQNGNTNVDYCFENTMSAKQQIQGFTTGVLLEGQYQIDGNSQADLFTIGTTSVIYSQAEMLERINTILGTTYSFRSRPVAGVIGEGDTEEEKVLSFQTYFPDMTEEDAKKLMNDPLVGTINYYQGGKTYYWSKPIKHFGDYYTPIYEDGKQVDYYDSADDYTESDHLGRYGVVRNNWYELVITSVSGPGYPTIPDIPTEPEYPDDSGVGYVKMEVNILSWAKRSQNVDL